jgi:cytidylate kinase
MTPEHYYRHLVEVLLALGQQGNKIIIGRGANFVLRRAIRVRLCATEAFRIHSIMKRENVSDNEARNRITRVEAERSRFINSFFHRDVKDPSEYDLIVNVDRIGFEPAAAAIVAAMHAICALPA